MSTLNNIYKFDDLNLNKPEYNTSSNYYEKKVKEGIPIFQEINNGLYSNSINNQNYIDPFKLLENGKTNSFLNNGGSLPTNLNMTDIDTRKIIEREINPYILKMKNELNIIVEKFKKEMEEKSNIINEISFLKEQIDKNKNNSNDNYEDLQKKIMDINNILSNQNNNINKINYTLYQINKDNKSIYQNMEERYNNLKNNKYNAMNNMDDKIYKDMNDLIDKVTSSKFDLLSKKIISIEKDNDYLKNDMHNINSKLYKSEDDKKRIINEISMNYNDIINKINHTIESNDNKYLNLFNNFEIKNNEFQQKLKSINDKISIVNNNTNSTYQDVKSNKDNIKSFNQKILEIENSISLLKNEKQSINNKITEIYLKLDSQSEKITKNHSLLNDEINQNHSNLYKDVTIQISKTKDLLDNLKDNYDAEILKLRTELNQFDLIIKNNPFLNMNENEKLSILFKQEQIKSNKLFSDQIKLLNEEINNIKNANPIDRSNFITIEKNFKIINKALESKTTDINLLEKSIKTYIEIVKALSDKLEKIKKDVNYPRNEKLSGGLPIISPTVNIGDFEDNIQKIEKYININKQDVNDIKVDIKEINEKTIPEIYRYINEKCKGRIDSQEPYNPKINQIKVNNSNNFNNVYNKNPININNNNKNQITESDYKITISNGNLNNNSNNNIIVNKNVNIEDLAGQIESMGIGIDYGNNNKDNINKSKNDSYQGKNSFFNNSLSINDKSISKKNDFDSDFDS